MQSEETFWKELDKAFRSKLTTYVNALFLLILKRNEYPGYAEDIVNETFTAAYKHFQIFDPNRGKLETWLYTIARNQTCNFLRSRRDLVGMEIAMDDKELENKTGFQEPEFLYGKEAKTNPKTLALRRALRKLSPYDQELLVCRLGNRLSYEEIERYFNFSVKRDTLRVHVNKALTRLYKELAKMAEFTELLGDRYDRRERSFR